MDNNQNNLTPPNNGNYEYSARSPDLEDYRPICEQKIKEVRLLKRMKMILAALSDIGEALEEVKVIHQGRRLAIRTLAGSCQIHIHEILAELREQALLQNQARNQEENMEE